MTIHLSPEHQAWLLQQVAEGRFASMDEAVAQAIEILRLDVEDDDEWVRPYLEEAEAELAQGKAIPGEVVIAELEKRIQKLRG